MPVIINEIIIRSTIETGAGPAVQTPEGSAGLTAESNGPAFAESLVRQAVERVLEIIEEKTQR